MVTMDRIDQLTRDAEQTQEEELAHLEAGEDFAVTGVQLNEASRMTTIYHRETGEPRSLPNLAAKMALRKRYKMPGSPLHRTFVFSATPTKQYHQGEQKCTLHPDNPDRAKFDLWGLPVCISEHIASPGEVRRHMELRHSSAFKIIREEEQEHKRLEELQSSRALAQSVLEAMTQMGGTTQEQVVEATAERPLYVSDKPKKGRPKGSRNKNKQP